MLFVAKNDSFFGALLADRCAFVEWVPYRHALRLSRRGEIESMEKIAKTAKIILDMQPYGCLLFRQWALT
jgi:hypothetical protein